MDIKTKYIDCKNCSLHFSNHLDGSIALTIQDEYGNPLINVTKFLIENIFGEDKILIKNYSENEGILECLIDKGIIKHTGKIIAIRNIELHVCDLLIDPNNYNQELK